MDAVGNLYIADQNNVAGNGTAGYSGDGVYPEGIALDASSNLYLTNWFDSVREVDSATGIITRVAGNGYPGSSGDGGSATVAGLLEPQGIAFDSAGNLYIAESGDYKARKVTFRAASPDITLTPSSSAITITQSLTATTIITLSTSSTYSGTMNLTCALTTSPSGAKSPPTCALSPSSLTLASSGTGTSKLTIHTTAASTSALVRPFKNRFR